MLYYQVVYIVSRNGAYQITPLAQSSPLFQPASAGCKHCDIIDRYSIWIANIGTILLIEFMYLAVVNEISSPIGYTDYVVQLLCKFSTT